MRLRPHSADPTRLRLWPTGSSVGIAPVDCDPVVLLKPFGPRPGPTSRDRTSSATAPRLPDAGHRWLPVVGHEISRFPRKERAHMPASQTARGRRAARDHATRHVAFLSRRRRHPGADFRGSIACRRRPGAGLCDPLSTLRHALAGRRRMTLGRCGSLLLHCSGLSPLTPCRSPGAYRDAPFRRSSGRGTS
jgi:hypothetical protein